MLTGYVKWFNHRKGFGFIVNGDHQDIFVHYNVIEGMGFRMLNDGETVEYEVVETAKGLCASRVRRREMPAGAQAVAARRDALPARAVAKRAAVLQPAMRAQRGV